MQSSSTSETEYWFIFQNEYLLLIKNTEGYQLPTRSFLSDMQAPFVRQHALGQFNQSHCYCAEIDKETLLLPEIETIPLRKAFGILGADWYNVVSKAFSVINWDRNHQFCGRCGNKTIHKPGTLERVCIECGLSLYPRISPTIIVLIKNGNQILMARSPHFAPGAYGLIAGFVEVGESIEDAVHREVKEEVGIKIKNLHYFGSQPWPFPDSLMVGFIADYASGELSIDHLEIEEAGWYRYDKLPGWPSTSLSIAKKLIDHFVLEMQKK